MSHPQQRAFCHSVRKQYPPHFTNVITIDVGSLDINGNNQWLFTKPFKYIGIDLQPGKNVDVIGAAHEVIPKIQQSIQSIGRQAGFYKERNARVFDTIISTETLEHDRHVHLTLTAMYAALKVGGLMLITAAGTGREEHGTHAHYPKSSPATLDYYQNISKDFFTAVLPPHLFSQYHISDYYHDFQFYGIKSNW